MSSPDTPQTPDALTERFGSDGLQHLVYASKAAADNDPDVMIDILRTSHRKNRAAGITGLLVYFDGRFLQYLEGPSLAVHGTLSLIRTDNRHHDMEILLDKPTDRRLFRTWDMGCLDVGSEGWLRLVEADWPTIRPLAKNSPSGLQVLQELAQYPEERVDRIRAFGNPIRPEEPIIVSDRPPELRTARLQLGMAVGVASLLALALLYEWVK